MTVDKLRQTFFSYQATWLHIPEELILKMKSKFILGTYSLILKYIIFKETAPAFCKVLFRSPELANYTAGFYS